MEVREGGIVGPADPPREGADRRKDTVCPMSCMDEIYIHIEFQVLVKVSTNSENRKGDHTSVYKQIIFLVSFSFKSWLKDKLYKCTASQNLTYKKINSQVKNGEKSY